MFDCFNETVIVMRTKQSLGMMMITVRSLNVLFSDVPVDVVVVVFLYSLIILADFVQCLEIFVFFRASVIIS